MFVTKPLAGSSVWITGTRISSPIQSALASDTATMPSFGSSRNGLYFPLMPLTPTMLVFGTERPAIFAILSLEERSWPQSPVNTRNKNPSPSFFAIREAEIGEPSKKTCVGIRLVADNSLSALLSNTPPSEWPIKTYSPCAATCVIFRQRRSRIEAKSSKAAE